MAPTTKNPTDGGQTRVTIAVLLFGLFLYASEARAQSCVITMSDHFGLTLVDPSMAYGFLAPGGGLVWYYNECGSGSDNWLYLDEDAPGGFPASLAYGHFHIPFADLTINCYTSNATYPAGVMGRQVPGSPCVAVNPLAGPRTLLPHRRSGVLRIRYLAHTGDPLRYLLPNGIRIIGSEPVSVLFQAANGSWWHWTGLTEGTWNLVGGLPAQRVFVLSSLAGDAGPWQIADLRIALGDFYTPPRSIGSLCLLCIESHFTTIRDFLTTTAPRRGVGAPQASRADVPGRDGKMLAATEQPMTARRISEKEALSMLDRSHDRDDDHDENMDDLLLRIPGAQGTDRQVLIAEYLLAASKLPRFRQPAAQRRLLDLFEANGKGAR
jgi:hypothetical protein